MNKLSFIMNSADIKEVPAKILFTLATNNFMTASDVREALPDYSGPSVNSNIGVLVKKGLVEKSGDGLVLSGEGTEIILNAANEFAAQNPQKVRNVRKPKGTTPEMHANMVKLQKLVETISEIKSVGENRSNLEIRLTKRLNGVRQFEIRRSGMIRVFGYKIPQNNLDKFTAIGASIKNKGANFYIDIETTDENMQKMVDSAK